MIQVPIEDPNAVDDEGGLAKNVTASLSSFMEKQRKKRMQREQGIIPEEDFGDFGEGNNKGMIKQIRL